MASAKTPIVEHWRTKARQPECFQDEGCWKLRIYVAKRKGDKSKLWNRVYSYDWKPDGWATEAAAMAARAAFKHWVDYERNSLQRQAQSKSVASRSSAALNVLLQTPEPTRVSRRNRPHDARDLAVSLIAVGGKVRLHAVASLGARPALTAVHTVMASETRLRMSSDSSKSTRAIVVQRRLTTSSVMSRLACHVYCIVYTALDRCLRHAEIQYKMAFSSQIFR